MAVPKAPLVLTNCFARCTRSINASVRSTTEAMNFSLHHWNGFAVREATGSYDVASCRSMLSILRGTALVGTLKVFLCADVGGMLAVSLRLCELGAVAALLPYWDAVAPLLLAPQLGSLFAKEVSHVWRLAAMLGA